MRFISILCAALIAASPIFAQDSDLEMDLAVAGTTDAPVAPSSGRKTLGYGRLFTNDFFGDTKDRWRTGSYTYSIVRGADWGGSLAETSAPLLEYRLRTEIIAPSALGGVGSDDRAYVGAVSAGLHSHFARGGAELSAGVDLVALGPQTGVADLQDWFHTLLSQPSLSDSVIRDQAPNAVFPTALVQATYPVLIGAGVTLRPFVEAQYGVEDLVRVGADVTVGEMFSGDLWLRDPTTGQLYSAIENGRAGTGFVFGADYTTIADSAYFPASFGTLAEEDRLRARAGMHWRFGDGISYFYGLTYLSEEYVGQPEGQIVGSLRLNFNF